MKLSKITVSKHWANTVHKHSEIFDANIVRSLMPFLEKTINEHVQSKDENKTKDFVDVMLGFMGFEKSETIEQPNIKAIIFVIIIISL